MATYRPDEDLLLTCPYDSNHRIAPKRFSTHVNACEKKSTLKLKTCPFNSCHRIAPELFDHHLVTCENTDHKALENWKKEQKEWESIGQDVKKPEVDELAGRMGAMGIAGLPNRPEPIQQSWDSEWNTKPVAAGYVIPWLEDSSNEAPLTNGVSSFQRQMMTPAERRKLDAKLAQETADRLREKEMAPKLAAQAEKERIERENREKEKAKEKERIERLQKEREKIAAEKAAKKKAAKEKIKAEKKAAFLASQAEVEP